MRSSQVVVPRYALLALTAVWLSSDVDPVRAAVTRQLPQLSQCSEDAPVMDITSNTCLSCSASSGLIPDTSVTDIYGNPLTCKCDIGYIKISQSCVSSPLCFVYPSL
jgi:hypothetical protein